MIIQESYFKEQNFEVNVMPKDGMIGISLRRYLVLILLLILFRFWSEI